MRAAHPTSESQPVQPTPATPADSPGDEVLRETMRSSAHALRHDVKAPLRQVQSVISILHQSAAHLPDDVAEMVELLERSAAEAGALIDGIAANLER